ncbi:MAG: PRC-barrel domain-containing protein [Oligoflexia bacterium]|nr:PRC-barrel domain-containing protein [Oligoflexia bacterium]
MLQSLKKFETYLLHALDGEVGVVEDCLFDDERWTVRFLVVGTGKWLIGRTVVISPAFVREIRDVENRIDVALSRKHVEESPESASDPHLFPVQALTGRSIQAIDGEFGNVEDVLMDRATWTIRYLVIETQDWWPSKKTLIAPDWLESNSWREGRLRTGLSREAIKTSPPFSPKYPVDRDYERKLYQHYRRQGYWNREAA